MLTENTLEILRSLKLHGMAQAFEHQRETPDTHALAFEERLGLPRRSGASVPAKRPLPRATARGAAESLPGLHRGH